MQGTDDFHTYVRWQPDTPESIPVTVGRIDWGWHGRAESPDWVLINSGDYGPTPDWFDHNPVDWLNTYHNE